MPSFTASASALKYASGSTWTSGKARQGVYSSTRYEGAMEFANLSQMSFANITITQIQLSLTFGPAGGDSEKYVHFWKAAKSSISGSISSMRGDDIGSVHIEDHAYDRTVKLTFDSSQNSAIYNTFKTYFAAGNKILILYIPTTRGTYSGGYCYDYLSVVAASITITYSYTQSSGTLSSTDVIAGSAAQLTITPYNPGYTHTVTWQLGSYEQQQSLGVGTTSTSFTIPLSWLSAIPSAVSGTAQCILETIDANSQSLGTQSYPFTVSAPASAVPSITNISIEPVNSTEFLEDTDLFVFGMTKADISVTASGIYGSTIASYSIITTPDIGTANASHLLTNSLSTYGTITVTATVTDTRGRSASQTTTFYVYPYQAPEFTSANAYRSNSLGTRDDVFGRYARVYAAVSYSPLDGSNEVSASVSLRNEDGTSTLQGTITPGTPAVIGQINESSYEVVITLTDSIGSQSTFHAAINGALYALFIKRGGRAFGIGGVPEDDETTYSAWPLVLETALAIDQGGTGARTARDALSNLGISVVDQLPDDPDDLIEGQIYIVPIE